MPFAPKSDSPNGDQFRDPEVAAGALVVSVTRHAIERMIRRHRELLSGEAIAAYLADDPQPARAEMRRIFRSQPVDPSTARLRTCFHHTVGHVVFVCANRRSQYGLYGYHVITVMVRQGPLPPRD
ncbi:hypothetical protein HJG45_27505 [Roseicella sp. DB1501]|nr:hypothetical protein [Roseicella sp. DB1501]